MSRLLLKLQSKESTPYEMQYHYHLQGLVYRLIDASKYDNHNKRGSKFFTFSNIFPFHDLKQNDSRNLIISSPNDEFVEFLQQQLEFDRDIAIGQMKFRIQYCDKLNLRVPNDPFSLITGTPIIVRIKKDEYQGEVANHYNSIY